MKILIVARTKHVLIEQNIKLRAECACSRPVRQGKIDKGTGDEGNDHLQAATGV